MIASALISFFLVVFCFDFSRCEESEEAALFQSWKTQHNKAYENKNEEIRRFKNFRENLEDIKMRNHQNEVEHQGKGAVFGLNQFSGKELFSIF